MKRSEAATTYRFLSPVKQVAPTVVFSKKSILWMEALVAAHPTEVGFYGVVEEDKVNYSYYVSDIFYPKHQVMNGATCEISDEGEANLMEWLIAHERSADISKMMLWGHSHHTMGVSPSPQDETQARKRMDESKENVIRIITNKAGLMSVTFFDYAKQIAFDDVHWTEDDSPDKAYCSDMVVQIAAIISSDKTEEEKIKAIDETLYSDQESKKVVEKIAAKIEELKKENVPSVAVYDYGKEARHDYGRGGSLTPIGVHSNYGLGKRAGKNSKDYRGNLPGISDEPYMWKNKGMESMHPDDAFTGRYDWGEI